MSQVPVLGVQRPVTGDRKDDSGLQEFNILLVNYSVLNYEEIFSVDNIIYRFYYDY